MTNRELYPRLLTLYEAAFRERRHEIAFHLLSAAAHAADDAGDTEALESVERLARDHLAWLDAHDAEHRLATFAARTRRHESVFTNLAATVNSMRARVDAERRREALRKR